MKIVNKEKAFANTVQAKAFEKEIETLMLIEHPNLAKQFDYFEDQVNLFVVTEYIKGGELFDYVSKVNRLSERQIAKVLK